MSLPHGLNHRSRTRDVNAFDTNSLTDSANVHVNANNLLAMYVCMSHETGEPCPTRTLTTPKNQDHKPREPPENLPQTTAQTHLSASCASQVVT